MTIRKSNEASMPARIGKVLKSKMLWDFLIYSFGTFLEKGIVFLLVPFYTRVLTPAEYGTLDTLLLTVWFASILMTLGLSQIVQIFYFRQTAESRFSVIQNLMGIYVKVCTPAFLLGWPIIHWMFRLSGFEQITPLHTLVVASLGYLAFFEGLLLNYFRMERQAIRFVTVSVIKSVIVIGATIILVKGVGAGITGGLFAVFIGSAIGSLIWLAVYFRKAVGARLPFHKEIFQDFLKTGLPMVPASLMAWLLLSADRYLLSMIHDAGQVGIYSTASKFAAIFEFMLLTAFSNIYVPKVMGMFRDLGHARTEAFNLRASLYYFPAIFVSATIFLVILWPLFPMLVGEEFKGALGIVPLLLVGKIFYGAHTFFAPLILYEKRANILLIVYASTLLVSVASNLVLIPRFSSTGAAITFGGTNLFFFLGIYASNRFVRKRIQEAAGESMSTEAAEARA